MIHSEKGNVLGIQVDVTDYDSAAEHIFALARGTDVRTIAAANTHLIAVARKNASFSRVLSGFDMIVPDGMPLVWALQLDGCQITDRVYGPYLMRETLKKSPSDLRHCFFGGSPECIQQLQHQALQLNPQLNICGAISPPFGEWTPENETELINSINCSNADVVWVALGGVKQETWIAKNRNRFHRGVFLAVGDAFVLVAGLRSFAPNWMQRNGLTWLYRLYQEPRRMFRRYFTYNTLFLTAFLRERWSMTWSESR